MGKQKMTKNEEKKHIKKNGRVTIQKFDMWEKLKKEKQEIKKIKKEINKEN